MSELARVLLADVANCAPLRVAGGPDGVCIIRSGSELYAIADRCSHADVRLSEGDVDCDEQTIECWKHGSAFSLVDGQPRSLPATEPVPVYRLRREGDELVVEVP